MNENHDNFLYLNGDNRWPDFQWEGLELRHDGGLQLFSLPRLEGELPKELASLTAPGGPAGLAVDFDGTIYFSDPAGSRLLKINAGDGKMKPLPFIGGEEGAPAQLATPRGLWVSQQQRLLFVADSGNHRLQIFDLDSLQAVKVLGQPDPNAEPQPSADPGRFNTPWTLVADAEGNIYVVDHGNQRVQKFNADGIVQPDFWNTVQATGLLTQPGDIAVSATAEAIHLYIFDSTPNKIFVFDADGHPVLDKEDHPLAFGAEHLQQPMGLVASGEAVYVGDNSLRRVLTFKKKDGGYVFAGEAMGYSGPVAALAVDGRGHLLVHRGTPFAPVRLVLDKSYATNAVLWRKAISASNVHVSWHRLRAATEGIAPQSHLRFFLHTSDQETPAPPVDPNSERPFSDPWRPLPLDVTDMFIGGQPARHLWVGAQFVGDGITTPVVSQMRVDFNHETCLRHLPPLYSNDAASRDFLLRFLSLFESFFGEAEDKISHLSALFDPLAVPKEMLPWLASWLALPLRNDLIRRESETEEAYELRKTEWNWQFFKTAIPLLPWRGTLYGMEALLRAWLKDELLETDSPLLILTDLKSVYNEVDTIFQLAPEKDQDKMPGEVYAQVGLTTVLGEGPPFFFIADLVPDAKIRELHYPAGIETLERAARFLLDSEKPAHTVYQLRIRAAGLTMQLAPQKSADRKPGEIYAQVGETTLLWEEG